MIGTLLFGIGLLGMVVAAAWAHELTHAAAARAIGGDVLRVDLRELYVEWAVPETTPRWQIRLIGLAPILVGGLGIFGYAVIVGLPTTALEVTGGVAVIIYAFGGIPSGEDVSLDVAIEQS